MSDGAVATIVTGLVTITTIIVGFLTLWVKLKYGVAKAEEAAVQAHAVASKAAAKAQVMEQKIDKNTEITSIIEKRTNGPVDANTEKITGHSERISALETEVKIIKSSMDSLSSNLTSTRHELRGHLQTITNNIGVLLATHQNDKEIKK